MLQPPLQTIIYSQIVDTSLKLYPAMHELHFVGSVLEHVAQGITQLGAHVRVDVKKYPSVHELHPPSVQVSQFDVQVIHVVPER